MPKLANLEPETWPDNSDGSLSSEASAAPRFLHVTCPQGHRVDALCTLHGQDVLCPFCGERFPCDYELSDEYRADRKKCRSSNDGSGSSARRWTGIGAAVLATLLGLVVLRVFA